MVTTYHIHIQGLVQGVGFRPFVYRLALQHQLTGWVNNSVDGVHIQVNVPTQKQLEAFCDDLQAYAPGLAHIVSLKVTAIADAPSYPTFAIIHSSASGETQLLLSPDFSLCANCRKELVESDNRRAGYAFITCTDCGVRYSILKDLPYDRPNTTMQHIPMCRQCTAEYHDPLNRRYYSQTNSCPDCPVRMSWHDAQGKLLESNQQKVIEQAIVQIKRGKIVAVKGVGGYLLLADAQNEATIRQLRERKRRPFKPFAVLYPGMEALRNDFPALHSAEEKQLTSPVSPIVLLPFPEGKCPVSIAPGVAPELDRLGVMLPYAPLLALLSSGCGGSLIATSANVSAAPIVVDEATAFRELAGITDFFLTHDRPITMPQDDSVVQYSEQQLQPIILRRSRGLAPTYFAKQLELPNGSLAMGAMLKSSFGYTHGGNIYLSQYLGDLQSFETEQRFQLVLENLLSLLHSRPSRIMVDSHPDYPSTILGRALAEKYQIPIHQIDHHAAHFAAVLAENGWLTGQPKAPVMGVIWDGTGLGTDRQIWGGEFFVAHQRKFTRINHLAYFPQLGGDKMAREPRLCAFSLLGGNPQATSWLHEKFSSREWSLLQQLRNRPQALQTSSVGRLFDAVAAVLGLRDYCSYEGEAAMLVEKEARAFLRQAGQLPPAMPVSWTPAGQWDGAALVSQLSTDAQEGVNTGYLALRFHQTLIAVIDQLAKQAGVDQLAFAGGVWQNSLLVDLVISQLGSRYTCHFHQQLSPNDESIAFGQLVYDHLFDS
ncbi:MAG: carbamoyltransferase HypF [Lewinellaceae bacterium]|nr:carbamoyltransferase HypF [Lewinellaceae bacterium]